MRIFGRLEFVFWKELAGLEQELFCGFSIFGVDETAFDGAFDLAHRSLVEPDAFGTSFRVDNADREFGVFRYGACRTG